MGNSLSQFGGWLVGIMAVVGTILYNRRKVKIDESALVLAKWKEFAEIHQADMKRLREEMDKVRTRYENELDHVRRELREVQDEFAQFRRDSDKRIAARDEEIAGLKRTISQISQSTAVQIGRVKAKAIPNDMQDDLEKLDRAGDNSMPRRKLDEEDGA